MVHTCHLSALGGWGGKIESFRPGWQFRNLTPCQNKNFKQAWRWGSVWSPWVPSPVPHRKCLTLLNFSLHLYSGKNNVYILHNVALEARWCEDCVVYCLTYNILSISADYLYCYFCEDVDDNDFNFSCRDFI